MQLRCNNGGKAHNQGRCSRMAPVAALPPSMQGMSGRIASLASAAIISIALTISPASVSAAEEASMAPKKEIETVYFGNGCFWGRQKEFVDVESKEMGRAMPSATVGYAGGRQVGPDGKVCYYYDNPLNLYERLGHAEVVKVDLSSDSDQVKQFRAFADKYFALFTKTPRGMMRLDPQDSGAGYRNVIGIPGGVQSKYMAVLQAANVNKMELREGKGNELKGLFGSATEDDLLNVVWIVDSNAMPFYQAEVYHQFHNGIGAAFPDSYTTGLKNKALKAGTIAPTGCTELPYYF